MTQAGSQKVRIYGNVAAALVAFAAVSCSKNEPAPAGLDCSSAATLNGTSWTPNPVGAGSSNRDPSVTVTKTEYTATGTLIGASQAAPASKEVSFSFTVPDLGASGSISLIAEPFNFPTTLEGGAFPLLVSLHDGTHELVNVARDTGACGTGGYFSCTGGVCSVNSACTVSSPSAFTDRYHWEQHQLGSEGMGYISTNIFPTCNWAGGTTAPDGPTCAFNSTFFTGGKLKVGTYTARYVLLTSRYSSLSSSYTSGVKLTVVQKSDSTAGGAIDLNMIFVGNPMINDSRSAQGKSNLDSVLAGVQTQLSQAGSNVKIGNVNVVEWPCDQGGDAYTMVDSGNLGAMFAGAGSLIPASTDTNAINVYMIQKFSDNDGILGIAGGLGGPGIKGLMTSGVAVATFDDLDVLTPGSAEFIDLQLTIAHEMGHYLGLNHTSERGGGNTADNHDLVLDTPTCKSLDNTRNPPRISSTSCRADVHNSCSAQCVGYSLANPCPAATDCAFNHLMWPFSKNPGDGNIVTTNSGAIINYHPYIQ